MFSKYTILLHSTCHSIVIVYRDAYVRDKNPMPPACQIRRAFIQKMKPEPTNVMKMTPSEKEYLLSQIQIVLSQLQCLVSQVSSVQCHEEEPTFEEKFICQNDVKSSLADEDVSSVSSLSWDTTEDFPVYSPPPSSYYNLCYEEENSDLESISIDCQSVQNIFPKECPFVNKMKSFLTANFPDNVFNKLKSSKLKQDRLDAKINPEFQTICMNAEDLFEENFERNSSQTCTTTPTPIIRYKMIDFTKVNVRSLANIPMPKSYPVHGCALDPVLYDPVRMDKHGRYDSTLPCHRDGTAHGFLYGYETDVGIVPVPDVPVLGHVWKDGKWVLHAVDPPDESPAPRPPWTRSRCSSTRRPPSTRSRWPT